MTLAPAQELDIRALYDQYGRAVYRRCQYFLKNDADAMDALHDVFLKVVERHQEFRAEASPLTWMVRIATNHCLNVIRSKNALWHGRYERQAHLDATTNQNDSPAIERRQLLQSLFDKAESDTLAAAVFYFVDEMTQEDAAVAAQCSVPTLRKRLRRFIDVARRELKRQDLEIVFGEPPV